MHNPSLILTLTSGLGAGLIFGYITNLLKLSPIVGYLLAGVAIGPFTPGIIADQQIAEQLAEIGVMLLMFGVGLHFHFEDLLAVRRIAVPGAIGQIVAATGLGAFVAHLFGWSVQSGIVYGLCLSVASTVVLTRVLADNRALQTSTGHVSIGWLIVEDLFTVLVLVLLPIFLDTSSSGTDIALAVGEIALKIGALIIVTIVLGSRVIPWLFSRVAASGSQELFTLSVLATALGLAVSSAVFFDVSMALGAFLAGMVVGKSEFSLRAASEALPLRDAFAVLFFVSVGMLLNPHVLIDNLGLVAASVAVVMVGKSIAALTIVLFLGYPTSVALGVAVALAQIGEFSFILATVGKQLGLLNDLALNVLVATAIISITFNPILYRLVAKLDRWIADRPHLSRFLNARLHTHLANQGVEAPAAQDGHTIVVGYGPVGSTVSRLLRQNGVASTVIELNLETTRKLSSEGHPVVYGDASRRETLEQAGIVRARTLILSSSSIGNAQELVRQARSLNPQIHILARTAYARERVALARSGCAKVFSGEGEVALALTEEVLRNLGATSDQIERERQRIREEIVEVERTAKAPG